MSEQTIKKTGISVNGNITVGVRLTGEQRYTQPDIKSEIRFNFGGSPDEFSTRLDDELKQLKHKILLSCGLTELES